MSATSVPLKDLAVGDIIYVNVLIDKADMADPASKSTTAKKFVDMPFYSQANQFFSQD